MWREKSSSTSSGAVALESMPQHLTIIVENMCSFRNEEDLFDQKQNQLQREEMAHSHSS